MATAASPIFIDASTIQSTLTHITLINHLKTTLPLSHTTMESPHRTTHQTSSQNSNNSSLLIMPSWSLSPSLLPYIGIKLVTTHPNNPDDIPGVHATYVLFDAVNGRNIAVLDGTELTLYRTASVSALASSYLSRQDSEILLMIGAGALAPHLVTAHLSVRPTINKVIIWNRNTAKARALANKMLNDPNFSGISFETSEDLADAVGQADIISCATNSQTPLVEGVHLKPGAHLDLVGSYTESMRECDDEAIRKGRVYVDNEVAMMEAGELIGAFKRGVITPHEVAGNLVELVMGEKVGRRNSNEITVFKSVGSATVDMLSAQLVYETFLKNRQLQK